MKESTFNITKLQDLKIAMRGAGDLATGVALRLHRSGFENLLLLETKHPLAVRRLVSFSEAVCRGKMSVEGVTARHIKDVAEFGECIAGREIPLLVDPGAGSFAQYQPDVVIDAIIAKRNTGTGIDDAELVIGLGPGFDAGVDVHLVVETMRGHGLGRVVREGTALPDTGIPGSIAGFTHQRLLRAPNDGVFETACDIGDEVVAGERVATVAGTPVVAHVSGVLRGLLRSNTPVSLRTKLGDIDPRGEVAFCSTSSDKAMAVAGGVLEAILWHHNC